KSTFFNILTGQLRADAGEVRWRGRRITGLPPHAIWRLGISRTFQITATFATLSALENVQVARLSHAGRSRALLTPAARLEVAPSRALLEQVGLLEQSARQAGVLAYGDLKKLELAIALADVHAVYGPSHVLHGVSLRVGDGEVVSLLGRNGAGKSTTLKAIVGVVEVTAGDIRFEGRSLRGVPTHRVARLGIGLVPEDRRIFADLTV